MKKIVGVIAIVAGLLMLSGCSSVDRGACLESHREVGAPMYIKVGNMMVPVDNITTVCDSWEYPSGKPL